MELFAADLPAGFCYEDDFISRDDERSLAAQVGGVEFSTFEMRGVIARRRVAFFGMSYDARNTPSPPLPDFLLPLRARLGDWTGVNADDFAMALINEYSPGAPIGWHRDAPQYGIVTGVSLLAACRMRLRPYVSPAALGERASRRKTTHEIELRPRSAYSISGEARRNYEHSIPAVDELRYSITFRTLRRDGHHGPRV